MKIKKTASSIVSALLVLSIPLSSIAASPSKDSFVPTDEQLKVAYETNAIEDEIYLEELENANIAINALLKQNQKQGVNISVAEENVLIEDIVKSYRENARIRAKEYKLANGWVEIVDDNETVSPNSLPSHLSLTDDNVLFNPSTQQYQFSSSFDFTDFTGWDELGDEIDILAIRSNNDIGIVSSYARTNYVAGGTCSGDGTWDNNVTPRYTTYQSGYDNNGVPTSGSLVTKRFENKNGVTWNIQDSGGQEIFAKACTSPRQGPFTGVKKHHKTDNGRATVYFTKLNSSPTNKIFLDYEHNWKSYSWQFGATLSGVNLSGSSLSVSYSAVNDKYLRTSTGKTY